MQKHFDDRKYINRDTYLRYANTNEEFLTLPLRGVVLELPGLGGGSCLGGWPEPCSYNAEHAQDFGQNGILLAYLFPGPWSWGNKGAVRMGDAVLDAICDKYDVQNLRLGVCGGSMGGHGALLFAADSRHTPCVVAAACPGVDATVQLDCRADITRTYISAVSGYDTDLEDALRAISPIYRIDDMPRAKYYICSDGDDVLFPEHFCNDYVQKLRDAGHDVTYDHQPGLGHGDFLPEVRQRLHDTLKNAILQG